MTKGSEDGGCAEVGCREPPNFWLGLSVLISLQGPRGKPGLPGMPGSDGPPVSAPTSSYKSPLTLHPRE